MQSTQLHLEYLNNFNGPIKSSVTTHLQPAGPRPFLSLSLWGVDYSERRVKKRIWEPLIPPLISLPSAPSLTNICRCYFSAGAFFFFKLYISVHVARTLEAQQGVLSSRIDELSGFQTSKCSRRHNRSKRGLINVDRFDIFHSTFPLVIKAGISER